MTEPNRAEKAHIRIGNRLYEAILDSPMTNRQKVICYALIRVTIGWHQASAELTLEAFARAAGMSFGGTFREALKDLEQQNVIIVDHGGAGSPNEWRLNEDFTDWGPYSVAPNRVKSLFGKRPKASRVTRQNDAQPQAAQDEDDEGGDDYPQAAVAPTGSHQCSLPVDSTTGSNPNEDAALDPRKDRKDRKDISTTATTPQDYALGLCAAANKAAVEKWGGLAEARPYFYGSATELAGALILEGVELATAQQAITIQIQRSKHTKPPSSISYFQNGILDAHQASTQRTLDARTPVAPLVPSSPRGGRFASLEQLLPQPPTYDASKDRSEADIEANYDEERARAARTWAEDPANASALAALTESARSTAVLDVESFVGKRAFASDIRLRIARILDFPDFLTWRRARGL